MRYYMNDLEKEIEQLRHELAVSIPEEINNIIGLQDSSDNSELSDILERQHYISIRLRQLTERLHVCKSISLKNIPRDTIGIGSLVTVENIKTQEISIFKLIVSELSDTEYTAFSEITLNSPLGKALLYKQVNDIVTVVIPSNTLYYKIINFVTIHEL